MPIVANREDILAYAVDLWAERASLIRDDVDGGFYWKFCRSDFWESLEELSSITPDPALGATEENLRHVRAGSEWFARWNLQNPSLLVDGIERGTVPLRGAHFASLPGSWTGNSAKSTALLLVMSREWTGERVEQEIRRRASGVEVARTRDRDWRLACSIRVAVLEADTAIGWFFSVDPFHLLDSSSLRLPGPGVLVEVSLPLPPSGVIAATYNQIADEEHLLDEIGPKSNGQTVSVAIRTWATALLVASGTSGANDYEDPKGSAIDLVDRALLGDADNLMGEALSISTYQRHLNELIRRVPESAAFLSAPKVRRKRRRD